MCIGVRGAMKIIAAIDRPDITEGSFGLLHTVHISSHLFTLIHLSLCAGWSRLTPQLTVENVARVEYDYGVCV